LTTHNGAESYPFNRTKPRDLFVGQNPTFRVKYSFKQTYVFCCLTVYEKIYVLNIFSVLGIYCSFTANFTYWNLKNWSLLKAFAIIQIVGNLKRVSVDKTYLVYILSKQFICDFKYSYNYIFWIQYSRDNLL